MLRSVYVAGYKSIASPVTAEFGLLTILAGANSSGKSSLIQPLLLLKQTLEAPYDPGALKLDGPNVVFTRMSELLSRAPGRVSEGNFEVGATLGTGSRPESLVLVFKQSGLNAELSEARYSARGQDEITIHEDMPEEELFRKVDDLVGWHDENENEKAFPSGGPKGLQVVRERCLLKVEVSQGNTYWNLPLGGDQLSHVLRQLLHLPGLRGNLQRTYPSPEVRGPMPGKFSDYAASLVAAWVENKDFRLESLNSALEDLDLTWKASATRRDASSVELFVARTRRALRGGARDLVNVADAGFAVSQALPVAVALVAAEPGQVVYIEQPEIHLHPRAQIGLARVVVAAVNRGVQVILETHSELLLTGLRRQIAEGHLFHELVRLHWFSRDPQGSTRVTAANVDQAGAFGEWPVDFAEVALHEDQAYSAAAIKQLSLFQKPSSS
jgi:hypothetical protein